MPFVLVFFLWTAQYHSDPMIHIEFASQQACERAGDAIAKKVGGFTPYWVCVPKG